MIVLKCIIFGECLDSYDIEAMRNESLSDESMKSVPVEMIVFLILQASIAVIRCARHKEERHRNSLVQCNLVIQAEGSPIIETRLDVIHME